MVSMDAPAAKRNKSTARRERRDRRHYLAGYLAGVAAGLKEAAEWHEAEAEKVQPSWPPLTSIAVSEAEALAIRRDISGHNRWSAMVFRARISKIEGEAP